MIVLYTSKTGFTQRYAEWIAADLQCEVRELNDAHLEDLADYGLVIYGGGVYAGRINGIARVRGWMEKAPKKTWVIFATGATPSSNAYDEVVRRSNFRQGEPKPARLFYFVSGLNYERMAFFDRLFMKFFTAADRRAQAKKTGQPAAKHGEPRSIDLANQLYIEPLVTYARLKSR